MEAGCPASKGLTVKHIKLEQSQNKPTDDAAIYFNNSETELVASGLNPVAGGWLLPNKLVLSA